MIWLYICGAWIPADLLILAFFYGAGRHRRNRDE
jgi:hypothetical protein